MKKNKKKFLGTLDYWKDIGGYKDIVIVGILTTPSGTGGEPVITPEITRKRGNSAETDKEVYRLGRPYMRNML